MNVYKYLRLDLYMPKKIEGQTGDAINICSVLLLIEQKTKLMGSNFPLQGSCPNFAKRNRRTDPWNVLSVLQSLAPSPTPILLSLLH